MVTLQEIHEDSAKLEQFLCMRVHPIAVKMLKTREEVPEGAIIPTRDWGHKYSLCQSFAKSQRANLTIAMFKEDMWCPEPAIGLGLVPRVEFFLEGHHRYPDTIRNLKDAAEWCRNLPYLEFGQYKGIVSAPASSCNFLPDLIVMHVTGLQLTELMIMRNCIDGKDIQVRLSGHVGCVYAIVPPLLNHECTVAIPCRGDRRFAFSQDDELLFTMLPDMLPDFIKSYAYLQEHNWGLPYVQQYKEEYDLAPGYAELGKNLGLDMSKSSTRR